MPWEHLTVPYSRATFLGVFGAVQCRLGLSGRLALWFSFSAAIEPSRGLTKSA